MKKILLSALLLPFYSKAQNFTYKAKVVPVAKEGFYRIRISPEISGYAQNKLQDLRLFDNKGKEIPYFLYQEPAGRPQVGFKTFPFALSSRKQQLVVTVENKDKLPLDELVFTLYNAEATRSVRISGSDDKRNWYVVRDSFNFQSLGEGTSAVQKKTLDFPRSEYRYYQIMFNNGNNELPLNIVNIGIDNDTTVPSTYQAIPYFDFRTIDSGKFTVIRCAVKPGTRVDLLRFGVDGPENYQRDITITFYPKKATGNPSSTPFSIIRSVPGALSSRAGNEIDCRGISESIPCDSIHILVNNKDDAPLRIRSLSAFQLITTITARLEPDKRYFLYFGDSILNAPEYDIVYFKEHLRPDKTLLETENVIPKMQADKEEYDDKRDKIMVWIGLALAGGILLLLTLSMIRKMRPA